MLQNAESHLIDPVFRQVALQIVRTSALFLVGQILGLGLWYHLGLAAAACFFVYQLWLIRERSREACFRAFLNNNYVGMSVFIGLALEYQFVVTHPATFW